MAAKPGKFAKPGKPERSGKFGKPERSGPSGPPAKPPGTPRSAGNGPPSGARSRSPRRDARERGADPAGPGPRPRAARAPARDRPRERRREGGEAPAAASPGEGFGDDRVQKRLAAAGIASRRTVDRWVAEGRVRINGRVAAAGTRLRAGDLVRIDGRKVHLPAAVTCRLLLYHKPAGEVTSRRDPEGRPTVFERLPRLRSERWVAVGRLDFNTSGVMLFATYGELAHRLMHPRYGLDREYAVRVLGRVDTRMLRDLERGVELDDGPARFLGVEEEGGEGANRWYRVVLGEGRNREVHRLWESQGVRVSRLIRTRFGPVRLPSRLPAGAFMDVPERERATLFETVELDDPGPPAAVRRRALPRAR